MATLKSLYLLVAPRYPPRGPLPAVWGTLCTCVGRRCAGGAITAEDDWTPPRGHLPPAEAEATLSGLFDTNWAHWIGLLQSSPPGSHHLELRDLSYSPHNTVYGIARFSSELLHGEDAAAGHPLGTYELDCSASRPRVGSSQTLGHAPFGGVGVLSAAFPRF